MIRVRFAPSPTGYLHVGGARTALFNFLFARHHEGKFVLRIEDTDRKRFQQEALDEIFTSLRWLGLQWDEGPEVGGPGGPYFQSERTALYRRQADELLRRGGAYRCFCSEERLAELRLEQERQGMSGGAGYDRRCRRLSAAEVDDRLATGTPHIVRLKVPDERPVVFHDLIRGRIETSSAVLDDQVLLKSDGFPTYHLANVVDDHFMGISHVMRGDEWISSTPRHVLMYEAFGWEPPIFAHLPVILSPGGGKLSKRKGAASVLDFRRNGYMAEALVNFLALLGWNPGDDRELMPLAEMIAGFSLERISPKAAVFDEAKLEWMNGHYLHECRAADLLPDVVARWREAGLVGAECGTDDPYLIKVVELMKERSRRIGEIADNARYFFVDPESYDEASARKHFKPEAAAVLQALCDALAIIEPFDAATLDSLYRLIATDSELAVGKLIHPTRLAVSGVSFGPGLFELLELLGRETVLRRLEAARRWLDKQAGQPA